ncbi:MAG: DUF302 domain-containing protein [Calditrichaceae bacterium]
MSYHFSKETDYGFQEAIDLVTSKLKSVGFGIITEIDITNTFKTKLNVDFPNYRILGACNPVNAHKVLQHDDKAGTMLPCNVVVQEKTNGKTEISFIDPSASFKAVENKEVQKIVSEISAKMRSVFEII